MLDMRFIRENSEKVKAGAEAKNDKCDIDQILELDEQRREIIREVEKLKSERNRVSGEIARKKKAGEQADDAIAAMREVGQKISGLDGSLSKTENQIKKLLEWVPNIPHDSVPIGADESDNVEIRQWGEKPRQDFKVLPHWEIGEKLGILDLAGGVSVSGSGFFVLKGMGALLQRALVSYMLDLHTADGFTEVSVPHIVTEDTMFGCGQLPKLAEDMYHIESDDLWLIPTGEVPITNLYKKQIINQTELPVYMVGHTPCFRREAGAAGKDTRGLLRVHQFDKVELVKICLLYTSPSPRD